eukprot:15453383-Alexandrium_andersonii.AAC.1
MPDCGRKHNFRPIGPAMLWGAGATAVGLLPTPKNLWWPFRSGSQHHTGTLTNVGLVPCTW